MVIKKHYDYLDEDEEDDEEVDTEQEEDDAYTNCNYLNELFGGKEKFEKAMAEAKPMTIEEFNKSFLYGVMSYEEYLEREKKLYK